MKILWSDFASEMLLEIYRYHKEKASITIARKIRTEIFTATQQLKNHPALGPVELNLEKNQTRTQIFGNRKLQNHLQGGI